MAFLYRKFLDWVAEPLFRGIVCFVFWLAYLMGLVEQKGFPPLQKPFHKVVPTGLYACIVTENNAGYDFEGYDLNWAFLVHDRNLHKSGNVRPLREVLSKSPHRLCDFWSLDIKGTRAILIGPIDHYTQMETVKIHEHAMAVGVGLFLIGVKKDFQEHAMRQFTWRRIVSLPPVSTETDFRVMLNSYVPETIVYQEIKLEIYEPDKGGEWLPGYGPNGN